MPEESVMRDDFDALRNGVVDSMERGRSFVVIDRPGDGGLVAQVVARWIREEADRRQLQRDSVPGGLEMAVSPEGDASSEEPWPTSHVGP